VLGARGFTGDVVASGVLDGLQKLQDATRSADKSPNTTSAWSSDVKIEAPETGVSILGRAAPGARCGGAEGLTLTPRRL
jgi:hypothetical protein